MQRRLETAPTHCLTGLIKTNQKKKSVLDIWKLVVCYGEIDTSSITSVIGNHVVDVDVSCTVVTLSSGESERLNECVVFGVVICDEK